MVICGATGDLTERKLAPALYNCLLGGFLPPEFTVVGFARRELTDDEFRQHLLEGINKHSRNRPAKPAIWESFARGIEYHHGNLRRPGRLRRAGEAARSDRPRPRHRREPALLPGGPAGALPGDRPPSRAGRTGRARRAPPQRLEARLDARHRREAVRIRPRERPHCSTASLPTSSTRTRSTGSTITSARRPSRTSPSSASGTACSSRSGTAATSTRSRSPSPRRSASRAAASSTTPPAPCATSSRATPSS